MTTPSVSTVLSATQASATTSPAATSAVNGRGNGATIAPAGKGHAPFADLLQRRHQAQAGTDGARLELPLRGRQERIEEAEADTDAVLTPAMALALLQQDDRFVAARLPGGAETVTADATALNTAAGIRHTVDAASADSEGALPAGLAATSDRTDLTRTAGRGASADLTPTPARLDRTDLTRAEPGLVRGAPLNALDTPAAIDEAATPARNGAALSRTTADKASLSRPAAASNTPVAAAALAPATDPQALTQSVTVPGDAVAARVLAAIDPAATTALPGSRAGAAVSPRTTTATVTARADTSVRGESANTLGRDLRSTGTQPPVDARRDTSIPVVATPAPLVPVAVEAASAVPLATQAIDSQAAGAALASLPASTPAASTTPQAVPGATPLPPALVAPTVGSPLWAGAFSHQMVAISQRAGSPLQTAELHLNPPDLGPLRVLLSMNGDQAQAIFVSAHGAVRSAVEAALPQLQQALADAGIHLGQASVGEQAAQENNDNAPRGQRRGDTLADAGNEAVDVPDAPVRVTQGLIDAYA